MGELVMQVVRYLCRLAVLYVNIALAVGLVGAVAWAFPRLLLAAILGAIGRRWAGGGLEELIGRNPGDYPTRALWGFSCAVAAHGPLWLYPAVAAGVFLGCATPIHWRQWNLGGTLNHGWREVVGLTMHGVGNMALPALAIWYAGGAWWWPLLAGITIAGWYQLGLWLPDRPRWPLWLRDGPRFAELIWGAVCAVACGM